MILPILLLGILQKEHAFAEYVLKTYRCVHTLLFGINSLLEALEGSEDSVPLVPSNTKPFFLGS